MYELRFHTTDTADTEKGCTYTTLPFIAMSLYVDTHRRKHPTNLAVLHSQYSEGAAWSVKDPVWQCGQLVVG